MKRDGHENIAYFIGPEVEHTPAYSKKTLFVVGKQDLNDIVTLARDNKATHIFMGANHSFEVDPTDGTLYWDKTITALLDRGFWVTLDYPAHQHQSVLLMLNAGIWQSRIFVPLLSVRIPKLETSSPNLTVKMDDVDFKASNPGVWCMHYREVTDSNRFTDWNEYATDVVITQPKLKVATPDNQVKTLNVPQEYVSTEVRSMRRELDPDEMQALILNDGAAGLDTSPASALKDDPEETLAALDALNLTPVDAAAAYAEGAKEDPLGKEGSKKKVSKK